MAKAVMRKPKKKVCQFCKEKATGVDYKDTTLLRKFISDRGKIRARRVTGNCVQHQRDVATRSRTPARSPCCPTPRPLAEEGARDEAHPDPEVTGLGGAGDVVEVKDGYGRNYLIPRGFAHPLDPRRREDHRVDPSLARRQVGARRRPRQQVKAKLEAGSRRQGQRRAPGGRLFGAVTVADIAAANDEHRRRGRQAHHRGGQPDQVARCAHRHRQGARRGRGR